ncbi:3-hydroxy-9,10-secoandrosta-1,3,5(10)-triene-9,17-dione monooxygenase [Paenibacillus sp. SORGH_AS306]|uniref:acyl-CoA dehydrogenase family protein n=1 Tax=unclassified Paenibacillus TaxID=185978 RepID=UPI002789616C|nr:MULTISPECIES: acyl-CoA dehydrogenase family protein [unclassified Paenibacillus]MDQ1235529.1 3-hydroxy-9,10-secoandrosta-1,3,5(10)-triene-9,17-dione monooxygenase [Paenibacillus sp. SORGH_AS_0306]MDR6112576.1 3-hydroxy-9,10-secoandrosta-1,3,5(10)-triene-9,17-dione monooxygenase [Paenibacillus sp. SORGH_AS_0338]
MSNLDVRHQLTNEEEQLLQRATDLFPVLRKFGQQIDEDRHIPEELIEQLAAAGLFKLGTLKKYGGYEVSIRALVEIISEVAKGNGSVGWVVQIINGNNFNATLSLSPQVLDLIFEEEEEVRFCSVLQGRKVDFQKVDGGYLVEQGVWGFASGSKHATHALLNLRDNRSVKDNASMLLAVVPMSEVTIIDDWYTMSLRGSSSNSIQIHNVFIPDKYIVDQSENMYTNMNVLSNESEHINQYKPYTLIISTLTTGISAILGLARGGLEYFVETATRKGITMTTHSIQAEVGHIQYKVGLAAMKIESAHLHINRSIESLEYHIQKKQPFTEKEFAQIQTDIGYAAMLCTESVDMLMVESGGSVIADSNPLSQIYRDIRGGANHALTTASTGLELYGRILLGLPPQNLLTLSYRPILTV